VLELIQNILSCGFQYISGLYIWIKSNFHEIIGPAIGAFAGGFLALWFEIRRAQREKLATINGLTAFLWVYLSNLADIKKQFCIPLINEKNGIDELVRVTFERGPEEAIKIAKEKNLEKLIDTNLETIPRVLKFKFNLYVSRLDEPPFDFNFPIEKLCTFQVSNFKVTLWLEQTRRSLFKLNQIIYERNKQVDADLKKMQKDENGPGYSQQYVVDTRLEDYNNSLPGSVESSLNAIKQALFYLKELGKKELPRRLHKQITTPYFDDSEYKNLVPERHESSENY
jgi:hypothetical protein